MAKIKGLAVTKLQGRLGNMVFRNRGGENIVSERPANVKNPRTTAQQTQRAILSTVCQAYSAMKEITDHSFAGYTYGAKNMERFMKLNLDKLRNDANNRAVVFRGNASVAPYPFIISDGSLAPISINPVADQEYYSLSVPGTTTTAITLKSFMAALNAQPGDQVTFYAIGSEDDGPIVEGPGDATQYGATNTAIARIVFRLNYTEQELTATRANMSAIFALMESVENIDTFNFTLVSGAVNFDSVPATTQIAAAVILSRKDGNTWQRSRQTLVPSTIAAGNLKAYALSVVLPTYDPSSPYYLNNAEG